MTMPVEITATTPCTLGADSVLRRDSAPASLLPEEIHWIYAGGVFKPELLHCVRLGVHLVRLESQNAAALGWLNRYVVFAMCGCPCWLARADLADDQRQHCLACWN